MGRGTRELPQLIIFDLDGTIIDSEPMAMEAWIRAGHDFGLDIAKKDLLPMIGVTAESNRQMILERFGEDIPYEAINQRQKEISHSLHQAGVLLKPGVGDLLVTLKRLGISRCIATSSAKRRSEDLLQGLGLLNEFEFLLSGEEVIYSKPHPEIFQRCMARMNISPELTMVVEDSKNGIIGAKTSKATSVLIPDLLPVDDIMKAHADFIFKSLSEFKAYLEELARLQVVRSL